MDSPDPADDLDYTRFVKKLQLPEGYPAPSRLTHSGLVATAITRNDLADDVRGINGSLELIRRTRGGAWPTASVTEDENYVDLVWHELEFRDGKSFTYVVRDAVGGYVGCCYLYPLGVRTLLNADLLEYDVDVSWWVTPEAYGAGLYHLLYLGLREWLETDFPFWRAYYSNRDIPDDDPDGAEQ